MNKLALLLTLIILLANISASCDEGQIDINTASLEELQEITHVGPKVAGYIVDKRPFNFIDDLAEVAYISEGYVEDIKSQGLACVSDEDDEKEEDSDEEADDEDKKTTDNPGNEPPANFNSYQKKELETINLNSPANSTKDIKTEENSEFLKKDKISMYGFFAFSVLIGILLIIRRKKIYKNDI